MSNYAGFNSVKLRRPDKSTFDLSHDKRLTARMGRLFPVLVTECVPSDRFYGSSEILMRLAPLLAPIYDQIHLFVHYFFIPNRLIWSEWETFITGGRLGVGIDPLTAPIPPQIHLGGVAATYGFDEFGNGSLADYLGVPNLEELDPVIPNWDGKFIDAMPFGAYQLCWYHYYRDRNFVDDEAFVDQFPLASGVIPSGTANDYLRLQQRAYLHDYFTSALPFTQRGEQVLIPLDGQVEYLQQTRIVNSIDGSLLTNNDLVVSTQNTPVYPPGSASVQNAPNIEGNPVRFENIEGISNISTTINDFRSAYALQVWLERNAIGGSRYNESTQAHFGISPEDSRLQRPEYIGGGRISVQISEVVATAWSNTDPAGAGNTIPQGNLAGHGISFGDSNRFNYFCTEHGFIMGIASIMAPPSYQQGLPRMFRRRSFLDYPWPTFAKLGEQVVNDYEIYMSPDSLTEDTDGETPIFGYQSRYADWKHIATTNHGQFRDTLQFWTLTRIFDDAPVLSNEFILFDNETEDRIFVAQGPDNFWLYIHNRVTVQRPLPYFGTPNTLGFV